MATKETNGPENPIETTGAESQAMFEAMVGHSPKIDTRTPDDVKEQKKAEGWK